MMDEERIVIILQEISPELKCTIETLRNPTELLMVEFCKMLIDIFYRKENAWMVTQGQIKRLTDPEAFTDSLELLNVFKMAQVVFKKIACGSATTPDFRFVDLVQPDRKRIVAFMSSGINFILFSQSLDDEVFEPAELLLSEKKLKLDKVKGRWYELRSKIEVAKQRVAHLESEIKNKKPLEETISQKNKSLLKLEVEKSKNEQLKKSWLKTRKEINSLQKHIQELTLEIDEFNALIIDAPKVEEEKEMLTSRNTELKSRLKQSIKDLNSKKADVNEYKTMETLFTDAKVIEEIQKLITSNKSLEQMNMQLIAKINAVKDRVKNQQVIKKKKKLVHQRDILSSEFEEIDKLKVQTLKLLVEARRNFRTAREAYQKKVDNFGAFVAAEQAEIMEANKELNALTEMLKTQSLNNWKELNEFFSEESEQ